MRSRPLIICLPIYLFIYQSLSTNVPLFVDQPTCVPVYPYIYCLYLICIHIFPHAAMPLNCEWGRSVYSLSAQIHAQMRRCTFHVDAVPREASIRQTVQRRSPHMLKPPGFGSFILFSCMCCLSNFLPATGDVFFGAPCPVCVLTLRGGVNAGAHLLAGS